MIKIGVTGGIGSGKSTVAKIFEKFGATVIDSDRIVENILEKNGEGYEEVVKYFGNIILDEQRSIDRKKVASIVFNDEIKRKKLEEIVHPLVIKKREEIFQKLQKELSLDEIVVAEAALIFEANTSRIFDFVVLVKANKELKIQRLLSKGYNICDIEKRINAQWEDERKEKLANFVIENNSSIEDLEKKVFEIIKKVREKRKNVWSIFSWRNPIKFNEG